MGTTIARALAEIIGDAIEADFWGEDSLLIEGYANENNGAQLDIAGLTIHDTLHYDGSGKIEINIGHKTFIVSLKSIAE